MRIRGNAQPSQLGVGPHSEASDDWTVLKLMSSNLPSRDYSTSPMCWSCMLKQWLPSHPQTGGCHHKSSVDIHSCSFYPNEDVPSAVSLREDTLCVQSFCSGSSTPYLGIRSNDDQNSGSEDYQRLAVVYLFLYLRLTFNHIFLKLIPVRFQLAAPHSSLLLYLLK